MTRQETMKEKDLPTLSRRRFLMWAAAGTASIALPSRAPGYVLRPEEPAQTLSFFHTHTEESLQVVYRSGGRYDWQALREINHILRDHRTGEIKPIDTGLLDLLYALRKKLNTGQPFHIVSGYRSPRTNEQLRSRGRGVARNSMHLFGKAVDIYVPGYELADLHEAALAERAGGVGYYPGPGFVHVDVGRVRFW